MTKERQPEAGAETVRSRARRVTRTTNGSRPSEGARERSERVIPADEQETIMLDTDPQFTAAMQSWRDQISYGDVVLYRFPSADGDASGAKIRPCLILDIEKIAGQRYAVLAYGTTASTRSNTGLEIRVSSAAARVAAGLDEATRFVGARRILVPLESAGFAICSETGSPIIGRLDGTPFERMNRVRARIHAERDIAADRRQQRRRRWLTRNDFVVEHRRPRSPSSAATASSK